MQRKDVPDKGIFHCKGKGLAWLYTWSCVSFRNAGYFSDRNASR
jgi:hypothetical protein